MKKTKKALLAAIACSAALAGAIGFAACNNGDEGHVHSWNSDYTIDTPATCTTDGSKSIHCSGCDETKDAEVIPAAHSWDEDFTIDTPAGCTTDGSKSIHCSGCDETKDAEVIPAAHSWADEFTVDLEPTCTAEGSKSKHCTVDDCDAKSEVTPIPANGHDWDEWDITEAPTSESTGLAKKSCKVDGCGGLIEEILPELSEEDYEIGEDSATCAVGGKLPYTYTYTGDDGNTEPITVYEDTPRKEFTLTTVSASTADKATTITLPSGSSLSLANWKYYECDVCHKLFSMDTSLSTDEARHTEANEITVATRVSISVGSSTNFNGPTKIGDNKVYFTNKGGILFKAEEAGVYKISPENATALFGLAYFGTTESGTTPSIVYKSGSVDKTAKQYSRFNYTNFNNLDGVYVRMDAGDVVGVAYTCVTKVDNFVVEKITDVSALNCYMHSEAYDVSGFSVNGGTFKYQCTFCGKEADGLDSKQPIVYTSGAVVDEANESSPVALTEDILVVKTSVASGTYYSFTPSEAKDYEITFDSVLVGNTLTLKGIKCGDDTAASYGTALTINSAFRSIINVESGATGTIVTLKVYAENVGKPFTFNFDVAGASADSPAYLTSVISSDVPQFITMGENTVNITDTNGFFDTYCFVSGEGGKFSITVPEGVLVQMNNVDLIKDNNALHAANFTVPAGVRVVFSFKVVSEEAGSTTITVTIGEPIEETYPTVTDDGTTQVSLPAKSGTSGNFIGAVGIAQVGAIESGKYTLTVKVNPTFRGYSVAFAKVQDISTCNEASYFNFFDDAGNVRTDEDTMVEAYLNTGDYSTATLNEDYTVASAITKTTWTITLDLAEGDFLVFVNGGTTEAPVTLSLTKVEE